MILYDDSAEDEQTLSDNELKNSSSENLEQRSLKPSILCCDDFDIVMQGLGFNNSKYKSRWDISDATKTLKKPDFATLISKHYSDLSIVNGVDLGAGADGKRWLARNIQSLMTSTKVTFSLDETNLESQEIFCNEKYLSENKPNSKDFVSIVSPYPKLERDFLSDADKLLSLEGLLYFSPDRPRSIAKHVAWLIAYGYSVSYVPYFTNGPGKSEFGEPLGVVLASKKESPLHESLSALGYKSYQMTLQGKLELFTSSISIEAFGASPLDHRTIADILDIQPEELLEILRKLVDDKKFKVIEEDGSTFYNSKESLRLYGIEVMH